MRGFSALADYPRIGFAFSLVAFLRVSNQFHNAGILLTWDRGLLCDSSLTNTHAGHLNSD